VAKEDDHEKSGHHFFYTLTKKETTLEKSFNYYPYGLPAYTWTREGEQETREKFQGKEYEEKTGLYNFHFRQYDGALGRFTSIDPKNQFASGYVGMGNNPVIGVDPDGQWVNFVIGAIVGGIGGYSTGKALGKSGWDLFAYTIAGAGIGAATAGVGSAVTAGTSATLGATGSTLVGGTVAGAFNGAAMAGLAGGNIGQGALYGSIGGLAGSTASLANVQGIVPGALYGAGTGGLISGGISSLSGGSFGDGFRSGAISGGILGGIGGGISAAQSKYERNILFGGVTKSGKLSFVNDYLSDVDAYNNGLEKLIIKNDLREGQNGSTIPVLNGQEITLPEAYAIEGGTKSNLYLKIAGRSLRGIGSTLTHEFTHVSDLYSGYANRYYAQNGINPIRTTLHLEMRGYRANIAYGYNVPTYLKHLIQVKSLFNQRY
jgi:RHS repeat-associated protein